MSMHIVSAVVAIVTLSEFVAESAHKRVEIFAGQIFDLACAKIPSWYNEGGIAVHGITYTRVHLHLQNSSFVTERVYRLRLYPSLAAPLGFVLLGSASTAQSFDASAPQTCSR